MISGPLFANLGAIKNIHPAKESTSDPNNLDAHFNAAFEAQALLIE